MKVAVILLLISLATTVLGSYPAPGLGPVKSCRCYTNFQSSTPSRYGAAELCHCHPAVNKMSFVDHLSIGKRVHQRLGRPSYSRWSNMFTRVTEQCTTTGPDVTGTILADDYAEVYMCGTELWKASLNDPASYPFNKKDYSCGEFRISLYNDKYSTGLSFAIKVGDQVYGAVGQDSSKLLPDVKPLQAYAIWAPPGYTSCYGVNPTEEDKPVIITDLENDDRFKAVADATGVYPIGVENGNSGFDGRLQCFIIENPTC